MLHNDGLKSTAKTRANGAQGYEDGGTSKLETVRDWLEGYLRLFWKIDMKDEFDRYEYEWVETGECYEETDGDVTYTVPVLKSVSYDRDTDVQAAAEALGFDCHCDECEHVVDWLCRQYDALTQRLRITSEDVACAKDDAIYVGVFDDDCARADAPGADGGLEPAAECAHALPPADEGSGTPWFPDGWIPDEFDDALDEGGVGAVWQQFGADFACDAFGLPNFLGDALVAAAEMGGSR